MMRPGLEVVDSLATGVFVKSRLRLLTRDESSLLTTNYSEFFVWEENYITIFV